MNDIPSTKQSGVVNGADDGNNKSKITSSTAPPSPEAELSNTNTTTKDVNSLAVGDYGYPFTTRGAYSSSGASPTNLSPWRSTGRLYIHLGLYERYKYQLHI